tara:strand:+ start:126 stop:800 length:675 start_codon:yes stop_codon:yes gene_type:complete
MATIHKGMINSKLKNSLKDSGLNNYDLATTKLYKGVVPMWKQLGFLNDSFDIPFEDIYWKNHVPSDFNYSNLSNVSTEEVFVDDEVDVGVGVGVTRGSKVKRTSYTKIIIDDSSGSIQQWDNGYLYPILPKIDKFGVFVEEVNTKSNYGNEDASITNSQEITGSLILNVDFNKTNTDKLEDLTSKNNIKYLKDFEVGFDENQRLQNKTTFFPDYLEKDKIKQAF